jgi:hypothetical protein
MAEIRTNGPQMGQLVIYTQTPSTFYPAIIVSVDRTSGLVRLTTFAAGGSTADQQKLAPQDRRGPGHRR